MNTYYIANENGDWWEANSNWGRTLHIAELDAISAEPEDIDEHVIREAGRVVSLDAVITQHDLLEMLRKANAERDRAEYALADYKRSVYTHVAQVYEEALDMFDDEGTMPGFITALAETYGVSTAFTCPVCKRFQPFEMGSGDCQTCEDCCKCATWGTYCMPYGATVQTTACDHDAFAKIWNDCKTHEEMDATCIEVYCDNCKEVLSHHN